MPGPRKKGYVRVPLPPAYLLSFFNEELSTAFAPSATTTYSKTDIERFVPKIGETYWRVAIDLPRTPWIFGPDENSEVLLFGQTTPYRRIRLMSGDVRPKENDFFIKWQEDKEELHYKVIDPQDALKEGDITKEVLQAALGEARCDAFIKALTLLDPKEIVGQTIKKATLLELLGKPRFDEFIKDSKLEKNTEEFLSLNASIKNDLLSKVFNSVLDDLLRITSKKEDTLPPGTDITIQETVDKSKEPEIGLTLTEDEARALYAFRCFLRKDEFLQGGVFSFSKLGLDLWLRPETLPDKPMTWRLRRNTKQQLEILHTLSSSTTDDKQPSLIYANRYEMRQEGDNFTLTRMDNEEANRVALIEENFFRNTLIPLALEKLKTTTFNDEDLRFFIPFLSNEAFAHEFFKKFMGQPNISKKTLNFLINHIALCFGELSFWDRHQGKISLSIVGLFLAAIIFTAVMMIFGLPAVVGTLGGMLFFGLTVAAVGVGMAVIGGLVGSKFDADYLFPRTLDSIKTESEGQLVEGETLGEDISVAGEVDSLNLGQLSKVSDDSKKTTQTESSNNNRVLLDASDEDTSSEERKGSGSEATTTSETSAIIPANPTGAPFQPPVVSQTSPRGGIVDSPTPSPQDSAKKKSEDTTATTHGLGHTHTQD